MTKWPPYLNWLWLASFASCGTSTIWLPSPWRPFHFLSAVCLYLDQARVLHSLILNTYRFECGLLVTSLHLSLHLQPAVYHATDCTRQQSTYRLGS